MAVLPGVGHRVDTAITDAKWRQTATTVTVYEGTATANNDLWLILPGLGVQDTESIRKALRPSLQAARYTGSVRLADSEFNVGDIADGVNRAQHRLGFTSVNLFLHSMSGTMLPDLLDRFDSSVPLGTVTYNCTPWTAQYVYEKTLVDIIAQLPVAGSYGTKLLAQITDRFFLPQKEDLTLAQKWGVVWDTTNDSGSPQTWLDQIRYLSKRTLSDYDSIPEQTQSVFLAPQDISSDDVVRLSEALATFDTSIPGKKRIEYVRSEGHANPRQYPKEYGDVLDPIVERRGLTIIGNEDSTDGWYENRYRR